MATRAGSACPGSRQMFEGPVQDLIDELGRLPGVGPKSAQRIAFHLLAADTEDLEDLIVAAYRDARARADAMAAQALDPLAGGLDLGGLGLGELGPGGEAGGSPGPGKPTLGF